MRSDPLASAIAPGAGQCFRYLIYLDIVGSLADPAMQNALRHLQARGSFRACIQACLLAIDVHRQALLLALAGLNHRMQSLLCS